jgi:hypothetical protein
MKRFSAAAAALALVAAATVAHAQGGPVNHSAGMSGASSAPVEASMAPPPAAPPPGIDSQIDQIREMIQSDLDQHKISHHKAAHVLRKLKVIEAKADTLDRRLAAMSASLP